MDTSIEVRAEDVLTFEALFADERDRLFTSLWLITRTGTRPRRWRRTPS